LDPPEPAGPTRPRSHRAETPASDAIRRFLAPLAAVTAVVVVIVLLLVLNGGGDKSTPGPALESPPAVTTTTSTPSPTHSPSATRSPRPRHTAPAKPPSPTATATVVRAPLTVLNNSTRYHLARRAADQIAAGGWSIKMVGNFTGRIPVSTVYYAPGQAQAAQALAAQFPAVQRVHPRFEGLPGSGLTLVVTREWPAGSS
jgi:hypothetical protein